MLRSKEDGATSAPLDIADLARLKPPNPQQTGQKHTSTGLSYARPGRGRKMPCSGTSLQDGDGLWSFFGMFASFGAHLIVDEVSYYLHEAGLGLSAPQRSMARPASDGSSLPLNDWECLLARTASYALLPVPNPPATHVDRSPPGIACAGSGGTLGPCPSAARHYSAWIATRW